MLQRYSYSKEDVRSDKPENIFSLWYTQRERGISLCEARFQRARCSKVEAIAVRPRRSLSEKDSDLRARKTIAVLQRNARRDYHRRLLFRLSLFSC